MELPTAELKKHFKVVLKMKTLFIVLSLCIMSVVMWGSYFLPKKYMAESTVFIEHNVIKELVKDIAITPSMEDRLRVLRYAMLSRGLILRVFKDLDLDSKARNDKELEDMIQDFQQRTSIAVKGNDLFIVSILDQSPKLARDYVNTLVRRYVEENTTSKREEAYGAGRFLNEQIVAQKTKLDKAEDAIIKYRQDKGIYLAVDEKSIIHDIKYYNDQLEGLKIEKNELKATSGSIKNQLKGVDQYSVSVMRHTENRSVKALENKLNALLVRYTENYPEVVKLKAEIEALKKQGTVQKDADKSAEPEQSTINPIYQELKQRELQTEAAIEANDAKQGQIRAMVASRERELRNIPESKRKLMDLEQERDAFKELYGKLLNRQGQSDVSKEMEVADKSTTFRIVDPAVLPQKPASPNRVKIFLAAIFLGLAGGLGGVFVRDGIDTSVKRTKTLRDLGYQVLAVIPKIYNEEAEKAVIKRDRKLYAIAGSYLVVLCVTMLLEIVGFSYVDDIVSLVNLPMFLDGIKQTARGIF
ncbi:Polysaccharide chain length determinant protein, PEP-CTERM locus subfamily [Candidatus Sulfobium mesophilum]|uniref:Polysaccharide chain length determinant protein, PEP-CTERM locus subfamily n=1 Tax=Candidatus Sulfobium mesophilum TaxID=2016548 RepID=A0A2U3QDJ6_9BACT|nr:Polysaccharide chain length determinant protein, PEP-CTERM locus subfamily [Candidatus Sulfobium mesophilum]